MAACSSKAPHITLKLLTGAVAAMRIFCARVRT